MPPGAGDYGENAHNPGPEWHLIRSADQI